MIFLGFSVSSQQEWPPELAALLPYITSLSELKVLVFVLDICLHAQLAPVPLTLDQIQRGTGLARQSTVTGLRLAREHGLLERTRVGLTYAYQPRLSRQPPVPLRPTDRPQCVCDMNHNNNSNGKQTHVGQSNDDDGAAADARRQGPVSQQTAADTGSLYHQLYLQLVQEFHVAAQVAQNILQTHDLAQVAQQMAYARLEIARGGIRRHAGYVVARIRDNWGPPTATAYGARQGQRAGTWRRPAAARPRWYTDEEFEIYFEHPPEEGDAAEEAHDDDQDA
jgi:hypothetical protein